MLLPEWLKGTASCRHPLNGKALASGSSVRGTPTKQGDFWKGDSSGSWENLCHHSGLKGGTA